MDFLVQQPGAIAASTGKDVQDRLLVKAGQSANGTDAATFGQKAHDLTGLFEIHPQVFQRLFVAKRRAAFLAEITLDGETFVSIKTASLN
jgi:hypothetical protein